MSSRSIAHSTSAARADLDTELALPGDSRTVTTVADYLDHNKVFNVKDYGAKGDGTTDNSTAIQAALAALPATDAEQTGGVVYFPAGVYLISETIEITTPGTTLKGLGGQLTTRGVSTLKAAPGFTGPLLKINIGAGDKGAWVRSLRLNGNGEAGATAGVEYAAGTISVAHMFDVAITNVPIGILTGDNCQSLVFERVIGTDGITTGVQIGTNNRHLVFRTCRLGGTTRAALIGSDDVVSANKCESIIFDGCELYGMGVTPTDVVLVRNALAVRLRHCWIEVASGAAAIDALVVLGTAAAQPARTLIDGCFMQGNSAAAHAISIVNAVSPACMYNETATLTGSDITNTDTTSGAFVIGSEVDDPTGMAFVVGDNQLADPQFKTEIGITRASGNPCLAIYANGEAQPRILLQNDGTLRIGSGSVSPARVVGSSGALLIPSGATASRPFAPTTGYVFFDTTVGKPIWYKGTGWVDATGAAV